MIYKQARCKECDAMLWSMHAKEVCMCPDCEVPDSDVVADLEERIEQYVNN